FSLDDLGGLVIHKSIKTISIIGHDRTRYVLSIGRGQRIDWETLQEEYKTFDEKYFDYYYDQVILRKMTKQQAWKEHSHLIVSDLAKKYGWEYRRVKPNEK